MSSSTEDIPANDDPAQRLESVLSRIRSAASGRNESDIRLVAVSKAQPPEAIELVSGEGQLLFGESKIQEARAKIPLLSTRLRWHFIGHLQKNKIRHSLPLFELFHSIDSLALASDVQRVSEEMGLSPKVLLEVNVAGESSKFGFSPKQLHEQAEDLLALDRLQIAGLMTIPPFAAEPELSRPFFAKLRELRDALEGKLRIPLPELSMGMSNDFEIAIQEGATFVRVGTAIFGRRKNFRPPAMPQMPGFAG